MFHSELEQADGSPLPSFITYDVLTKLVTINVAASQVPATITVKACAYLNDKVTTAKSECKQTIIKVFSATSLAFTLAAFSF